MDQARAQALAQLESIPDRGAADKSAQPAEGGGLKGPRVTYQTSTSGPSFGHILHQDGHPVPGRLSLQHGPGDTRGSVPMTRDSDLPFFRIPFGVPMGAMMPRPMLVTRTGTGMNMGIAIGGHLQSVTESPGNARRKDRSAYMETVEDVNRSFKVRADTVGAGTYRQNRH